VVAERVQRERTPRRVDEVSQDTAQAGRTVDYDAILDQIDAALEADAEEYVRSFVQKGGQ
jgi:ubiquitin-like protein Pup